MLVDNSAMIPFSLPDGVASSEREFQSNLAYTDSLRVVVNMGSVLDVLDVVEGLELVGFVGFVLLELLLLFVLLVSAMIRNKMIGSDLVFHFAKVQHVLAS